MRSVLVAILLELMTVSAGAQALQADEVRILDFGIPRTTDGQERESPKMALGRVTSVVDFKLVEPSDTICARMGQPSGFSVDLDWVTRFPPPGVVYGKGQRFEKNELISMRRPQNGFQVCVSVKRM